MTLVSSSRSMEKQVFGFTFHSLMLVKGEHSLVLVKELFQQHLILFKTQPNV
ncbi:hypothetical protein YC2023_040845 [Brassica napus]